MSEGDATSLYSLQEIIPIRNTSFHLCHMGTLAPVFHFTMPGLSAHIPKLMNHPSFPSPSLSLTSRPSRSPYTRSYDTPYDSVGSCFNYQEEAL